VAYPEQQAHCKSQLSKMVELRLDSVDDASMPSDCYVSVRVGDIQKLSRLSSTRVYRFPQASDKRYGKIEVFRRIGACSVDVDPLNENLRNVSISCQEAGFGSLGLKIAVEADEGTKKKSETTDPVIAGKKPPTKVKEAKEYLSKHSLEVRLSEAMQAVLRERPEDPTAFLASKLLEHTKSEKRPPLEISSPQPQKLEHVGTAAKPAPPATKDTPHNTLVVPFASFYKDNFKQIKGQAFQSIYDKFPKPKVPQSKQSSEKSSAAPLCHKPSVGTWVKTLPKYVDGVKVNCSAAPAVKDTAAASTNWTTKPSVGTWLKPIAKKSIPAVAAPSSAPAPATRPEPVGGPTKDWALKPSAGTWVARPVKINQAAIQKAKKEWVLKPSVGTWLSTRFVEEEVEEEKPKAMVLTTQVMMGPAFYGMGLRPMMAFI